MYFQQQLNEDVCKGDAAVHCSSGIYLWRSRDSGVADNMCGNVCIWWYKHPWYARAECRRKCTMLCVILKFSSVNSIWRLTTIVCEIVVIVDPIYDSDRQVLWMKSGIHCYQHLWTKSRTVTATVCEIFVIVVPVCDSDRQVLWTKSDTQYYQQHLMVTLSWQHLWCDELDTPWAAHCETAWSYGCKLWCITSLT